VNTTTSPPAQVRIEVSEDVELAVEASPRVASMYHLSPYVWREENQYAMLLRVVNRSEIATEKVARVHFGTSDDGIRFLIDDDPVLAPGPSIEDLDGCEDPTVAESDGTYYVYYSGWNGERDESNLLLATGRSARELTKRGLALASSPQYLNPKEATLQRTASGWRLFFEYARHDRSHIGLAVANSIGGPWVVLPDTLHLKPQGWDSGMRSPGPLVRLGDQLVMFYNGATNDGRWKIGWMSFDADLKLRRQSDGPILLGSAPEPSARDMAFVSSTVVIDQTKLWLYYSVADMQMRRATILVS